MPKKARANVGTNNDLKPKEAAAVGRISPSRFMRQLRPEYYSDTEDHVLYVLNAAMLDHHLETITSRNQTHDFELFARKLCERIICPNLRPQTGPEGGGDSKADSETYPVADEISRIYIGEVNSGRERHIAIIRHLPERPPSYYVVLVASRVPDKEEFESSQMFSMTTRSMTMTPDTTVNLQRFLDSYKNYGGYYLLPAVMKEGQTAPISELALIKRALTVKDASEVRETDIENIALRMRGNENRAPEA